MFMEVRQQLGWDVHLQRQPPGGRCESFQQEQPWFRAKKWEIALLQILGCSKELDVLFGFKRRGHMMTPYDLSSTSCNTYMS